MVHPEKPQLGMIDNWYHPDCFVSRRAELGFLPAYGATQLLGFSILKAEDKETLKKQLPATKTEGYVGNAVTCDFKEQSFAFIYTCDERVCYLSLKRIVLVGGCGSPVALGQVTAGWFPIPGRLQSAYSCDCVEGRLRVAAVPLRTDVGFSAISVCDANGYRLCTPCVMLLSALASLT